MHGAFFRTLLHSPFSSAATQPLPIFLTNSASAHEVISASLPPSSTQSAFALNQLARSGWTLAQVRGGRFEEVGSGAGTQPSGQSGPPSGVNPEVGRSKSRVRKRGEKAQPEHEREKVLLDYEPFDSFSQAFRSFFIAFSY